MHFLTVFWKVLFAFVPPTEYWNGWACFFVSISLIGVLTAVTGDLASHFGCTIGLKDSVTAVVFVALGTSVPGGCPQLCFLWYCGGFLSAADTAAQAAIQRVCLYLPLVLFICSHFTKSLIFNRQAHGNKISVPVLHSRSFKRSSRGCKLIKRKSEGARSGSTKLKRNFCPDVVLLQ